jgi:hypothetical protein
VGIGDKRWHRRSNSWRAPTSVAQGVDVIRAALIASPGSERIHKNNTSNAAGDSRGQRDFGAYANYLSTAPNNE